MGILYSKKVGNILADHFAQVSQKTDSSPGHQYRVKEQQQHLDFSTDKTESYNIPFTAKEFDTALDRSKNTAPGPDMIPYEMFKHTTRNTKLFVISSINRLWQEHKYPTIWETAFVLSFLKPGKDPYSASSYRPIALTCCLGKIMEKMKRHMTAWRHGILKIIHDCGLRGELPLYIKAFLSHRYFKVKIGNTLSDKRCQEEGVPQGSILSVTLFALAINGVANIIPDKILSTLYVDDLSISFAATYMPVAERKLQLVINKIVNWAEKQGFKISTSKTIIMHFCRIRGIHPDPNLYLYGNRIPCVEETRFQGLIFDKKLTGHLKILDSVHHNDIRLATGAFRSSPIPSLLIDAREIPLELYRQSSIIRYFKGFKKDKSDAEIKGQFLEHITEHLDSTFVFTDGSKTDAGVGYGVFSDNFSCRGALPIAASNFTAELYGILTALEHITLQTSNFTIYCDSKCALQSIEIFNGDNPLTRKISQWVFLLQCRGTISFCWVPAHVHIYGNEKADQLAKSAAASLIPKRCAIPYRDILPSITNIIHKSWKQQWNEVGHNKMKEITTNIHPWKYEIMPRKW
ncbi:uncharacterized protein LOC143037283 [Oratosquilla oratoria]|uniref:uncharacterized protein LOC143037283 n=1 Tax=Oratosquilla oratoria TaxID=337810 RepID=UPI003F777B9E